MNQLTATEPVPSAAAPQGALLRTCANCGTALSDRYCGRCGQKDFDIRRSTGRFFQDMAESYLRVDGKLVRTAMSLLFRPGELTELYLAGKRKQIIRPFRVYLTASAFLFAAVALHTRPEDIHVATDLPSGDPRTGPNRNSQPLSHPAESAHKSELERRVEKQLVHPEAFKQLVIEAMTRDVPRAMFFLVPISALLLKVLFRRSYYVEHYVFALYLHAFVFLALCADSFSSVKLTAPLVDGLIALYTFAAMGRVYRQSRLRTAWKGTVALLSYLVVVMAALSGVFVARLYFAGAT